MTMTANQITDNLRQLLSIAGAIDPKIAVASAGVEAIRNLFAKTSELNAMLAQVYAETTVTAPEVAQAVSAFYVAQGDALEASIKNHPGR